jgi:hypothetical protein
MLQGLERLVGLGLYAEGLEQLVIIEFVGWISLALRWEKYPLVIHIFDQLPAIGLPADSLQTHGVDTLKDILAFTVGWSLAVFLHEPLDLLEAGDDSLLLGSPIPNVFLLHLHAQLGEEVVVFLAELATH